MENLIDLIDIARTMLDAGLDVTAFLQWKHLAFVCLLGLLGPLHFYVRRFSQLEGEPTRENLLAAMGFLEAATQQIGNPTATVQEDGKQEPTGKAKVFRPWAERKKRWYPLGLLSADSRE